jgi:hypothetical protein
VFSHLPLQSDTERKKFGSFLVPLTSSLSFGFCPGTMGARPVFHIVYSPSDDAQADSGLKPPAAEKPMVVAISDENACLVHSLRPQHIGADAGSRSL